MKKSNQLIIGLLIALLASYFTFRNVTWEEFANSFKDVNYIYLLPAIFFSILSYIARVYRWNVLLSPLKTLKPSQLYSPLMVGFMGNLLPARAGEVIRAWLVGKQNKIPFSGAFATIIIERLFDLIMLLTLFSWLLIFKGHIFEGDLEWSGISLAIMASKFGMFGLAVIGIIVALILLMLYQRSRLVGCIQWCIRPLPEKWHDSVEHLIEKFSDGLHVVKDLKEVLKLIFWTLMVWILMVLSYYPFFWAYDLNNKSVESLIVVIVFICIFISVFPTPGFVGSYHAGILIALHEIIKEPEVTAVSFGMLAWGLNMLIIVMGGVYFLLHEHLSVQQLVKAEENS